MSEGLPLEARDNIARYLGVGRRSTIEREAVVEAAEQEPEEYGYLVEQRDRIGKVVGAFRRLSVLKQAKELETTPSKLPTGPFQMIVADPTLGMRKPICYCECFALNVRPTVAS